MNDETPKLDIVGDESDVAPELVTSEEEEQEKLEAQREQELANIIGFWTERSRVACEVASKLDKQIFDERQKYETISDGEEWAKLAPEQVAEYQHLARMQCHLPSAGDILQAMSQYELPGRLIGQHYAAQQAMMKKMQSNIATAKAVPQLQKGPRRKRR